MQLFAYTARDQRGTSVKGKIEARDVVAAAGILRERQLVIIELIPIQEFKNRKLLPFSFQRVSQGDIVTFTQQMSTMINAGLPLSDALAILQTQSKPAFAKIVGEIARDIQGGASLSQSLVQRKVFSEIYISSIRAGETAGKMDEVLVQLADTEEKKREFTAKTKGALIYPIIVMTLMLVIMVAMLVFVIPKLTSMFDDFGATLPITTVALIAISNFAKNSWWIVMIVLVGTGYAVSRWYQTKKGREIIDGYSLKLPVYGELRTQVMLADTTRTLALLVGAGVSILDALEIVRMSTNNVVIGDALKRVAAGVEKGLPLAITLARESVFPPLLSQMVSVGEETGQLHKILLKLASYFEGESDHSIKNLTTAIEPLIMIVLGVGVMFLVLAIVMPIYQLTSNF